MRAIDLVIISISLLPCDVKRRLLEGFGLSKICETILRDDRKNTADENTNVDGVEIKSEAGNNEVLDAPDQVVDSEGVGTIESEEESSDYVDLTISMKRKANTNYSALGASELQFYDKEYKLISLIKSNGKVYLEINECQYELSITVPSCGHYAPSYGWMAVFGVSGYGYLSGMATLNETYSSVISIPSEAARSIGKIHILGRSKNSSYGISHEIRLDMLGKEAVGFNGGPIDLILE